MLKMLMFLFYRALNPVEFSLQVQIAFCGVVISMSIPFLKPCSATEIVPCMCHSVTSPGSRWYSGSSVLKDCGLLFWVIFTSGKLVGERRSSQTTLWACFPELLFLHSLPSTFQSPGTLHFQSSSQTAGALFNIFYLNMLLHLGLMDGRIEREKKSNEISHQHFRITIPLIKESYFSFRLLWAKASPAAFIMGFLERIKKILRMKNGRFSLFESQDTPSIFLGQNQRASLESLFAYTNIYFWFLCCSLGWWILK